MEQIVTWKVGEYCRCRGAGDAVYRIAEMQGPDSDRKGYLAGVTDAPGWRSANEFEPLGAYRILSSHELALFRHVETGEVRLQTAGERSPDPGQWVPWVARSSEELKKRLFGLLRKFEGTSGTG